MGQTALLRQPVVAMVPSMVALPDLLAHHTKHADKKQDRDALAKPLQSILQEVEGTPVVKTEVLFRSVPLSTLYSYATQHC